MAPKSPLKSFISGRQRTKKKIFRRTVARNQIYGALVFPDEIRLLNLLPGEHNLDLVGELVHVRLKDEPVYEAVSYTWANENGDVRMTGCLHLRNVSQAKLISENCEAALRRFRRHDFPTLLWIDSVCINQKDIAERGHQVKIMPSVYSSAHKVLVFLGNDLGKWSASELKSLFEKLSIFSKFSETLGGFWEKRFTDKDKAAWKYFLERRWFNRIWTLQEVILARSCTFYLGEVDVDWQDLCAFDWPDQSKPAIFEMWDAMQLQLSLEKALCIASRCNASECHDKVYAILGLLPPKIVDWIQPDYTMPFEIICKEITEACMKSSQSPSVLAMKNASTSWGSSWVVDFSQPFLELRWYHAMGVDWTSRLDRSLRGMPQFWRKGQPLPSPELLHSQPPKKGGVLFQVKGTSVQVAGTVLETVIRPWTACHEAAEELSRLANESGHSNTKYPIHGHSFNNRLATYRPWEQHFISMVANVWFGGADLRRLENALPYFFRLSPRFSLPFVEPKADSHYDIAAIDLLAPAIEVEEFEAGKRNALEEEAPYLLGAQMAEYLHFLSPEDIIFFGEHSFGFGPRDVYEGDLVYDIEGVPTQILLRRVEDGFQVIGRCSITSFRKSDAEQHKHEKETLILV